MTFLEREERDHPIVQSKGETVYAVWSRKIEISDNIALVDSLDRY